MGLVAAAIGSLVIPMAAIAALGGLFSDLTGVQKGAEAIKQCAIALKYVSEAFGYIVTVQWDMLLSGCCLNSSNNLSCNTKFGKRTERT